MKKELDREMKRLVVLAGDRYCTLDLTMSANLKSVGGVVSRYRAYIECFFSDYKPTPKEAVDDIEGKIAEMKNNH